MIIIGPIKPREREGLNPEDDDLVPVHLVRPQMFVPYYHQLPPLPPVVQIFVLMPQIVT
jgi:hypothetical protein